MAVRLEASNGEYLSRTTDLPDQDGAYTICGWIRFASIFDAIQSVVTLGSAADEYDALGVVIQRMSLSFASGRSTGLQFGSLLSANQWYHVAMRRTSTTLLDMILDLTVELSETKTASRPLPDRFHLGADWPLTDGTYGDFRLWGWKCWTRALSNAEIAAESLFAMPITLDSLHGVWPFIAGGTREEDYSGNGRDWTENGTLSDEDPPNVAWRPQSPARFQKALTEVIDEVVQLVESTSRRKSATVVVDDTVQLVEQTLRALQQTRLVNSTVQIVETDARSRALVRLLSESAQLLEDNLRVMALARVVTGVEQIVESASNRKTMTRVISEVENLDETAPHRKAMARLASSTLSVVEQADKVSGITRTVSETAEVSETVAAAKGIVAQVDHVVQLVETLTRSASLVRVVDEDETVDDDATRARELVRLVDEVEQLDESLARLGVLVRQVDDEEQIDEVEQIAKGMAVVVSDLAEINETANAVTLAVGPLFVRSVDICLSSTSIDTVVASANFDVNVATAAIDVSQSNTTPTV